MPDLNDLMPTTPDLNRERLEQLKRLMPDLFNADGRLDPEELKRVVDPGSVPESERFEFRWFGKADAKRRAFTPTTAALQYDDTRSVNPEVADGNMIIEGENLEALKCLLAAYREKIKCIYIDPPYNTGNDFVYSDNYSEQRKAYWEQTGVTEEGIKVDTNSESDGRYHSNWLNMMYPRLLAARQLLREDGIILISIDDHEYQNLKHLMDETFGKVNYIATLIWEKGRKNDAKLFSVGHEYLVVYAKSKYCLKEEKAVWREEKPGAKEIWGKYLELKQQHGDNFDEIENGLTLWFKKLPKKHPSKKLSRYRRVDKFGPWRDRDISWPGGGGPRWLLAISSG
jgi:adenine-specific DNA-methyltransferase